jgi:hypothetical protein
MLKCTNWDIFCTVFVPTFLAILIQGGLFCVQGVYVAGIVCYKCIGCIIDRFKEKAE